MFNVLVFIFMYLYEFVLRIKLFFYSYKVLNVYLIENIWFRSVINFLKELLSIDLIDWLIETPNDNSEKVLNLTLLQISCLNLKKPNAKIPNLYERNFRLYFEQQFFI